MTNLERLFTPQAARVSAGTLHKHTTCYVHKEHRRYQMWFVCSRKFKAWTNTRREEVQTATTQWVAETLSPYNENKSI